MRSFFRICCIVFAIVFFAGCKKEPGLNPPKFVMFQGIPVNRVHISTHTMDGNVCFVSQQTGGNIVQKVDPSGKVIWSAKPTTDQLYAVAETSGGEIFACGYSMRNYPTNSYDMVLFKFDANGDTVWTKTYGGKAVEYALDMCATPDGNLLLSGIWSESGTGRIGPRLLQIKPDGDTMWSKNYLNQNYTLTMNQVQILKNGDILLTGDYAPVGTPRKTLLRRLNPTGTLVWEFVDTGTSMGRASVEMADGSLVTCGTKNASFQPDVWVQRISKDGQKIWDRTYGTKDNFETANDMKLNQDGTMMITGSIRVQNILEVILLHIDGDGSSLMDVRFGIEGSAAQGINLLKAANDDNLILGQNNDKAFLVRTDNQGRFK
jgi:hypothetical protein